MSGSSDASSPRGARQTGDKGDLTPDHVQALMERYRIEREKRIRSEGNLQYMQTTDTFLELDEDPYAVEEFTRAPLEETVDVVIVGGGLSGLLLAVRLRQAGIKDIRVIERASDVGGTWYWNRYPGLACDVESYIYMPLLEEVGYVPTEKYARGLEIQAHMRRIADAFDLYPSCVFRTLVTGARWDASSRRWVVTTNRGDTFHTKFFITAGGVLHKPKLPAVSGIETFKGRWFHTSRWDYGYTGGDTYGNLVKLHDKRVGIIGTGSTAIQCVPILAKYAKHLCVFQRTPAPVNERNNRPTDPSWVESLTAGWQRHRMDNYNTIVSGGYQEVDLVNDGWTDIYGKLPVGPGDAGALSDPAKQAERRMQADFKKMEEIRARVDATVKDPETAEALKPYYYLLCKRPCFSDEYLQTFNRENVTLVDTQGRGVDRITERGVVVQGREYELDCLIFATGYEFDLSTDSNYSRRLGFDVVGRDGCRLSERWRDGALTFHGFHTHGFPNYFICSVLQSGLSPNLTHSLDEKAKHLAYIVATCQERGIASVEATEAAEAEWVESIVTLGEPIREFNAVCTPSYLNNEGKQNTIAMRNNVFAAGPLVYFDLLERWRSEGQLSGLKLDY